MREVFQWIPDKPLDRKPCDPAIRFLVEERQEASDQAGSEPELLAKLVHLWRLAALKRTMKALAPYLSWNFCPTMGVTPRWR